MDLTEENINMKIEALILVWGWATNVCEGAEEGELSAYFLFEVETGKMTEEYALKCQKMVFKESEILHKKISRLRIKQLKQPKV